MSGALCYLLACFSVGRFSRSSHAPPVSGMCRSTLLLRYCHVRAFRQNSPDRYQNAERPSPCRKNAKGACLARPLLFVALSVGGYKLLDDGCIVRVWEWTYPSLYDFYGQVRWGHEGGGYERGTEGCATGVSYLLSAPYFLLLCCFKPLAGMSIRRPCSPFVCLRLCFDASSSLPPSVTFLVRSQFSRCLLSPCALLSTTQA